jgi:PAS domain-containing protein
MLQLWRTRQVISDRRLSTVRTLSDEISKARTIKDLWRQIIRGLEYADKDVPFALLYSVANVSEAARLSSTSEIPGTAASVFCTLEGFIGIQDRHSFAPVGFDLTQDRNWLSASFQSAERSLKPVLLPIEQELQKSLEDIECRGFGVPPSSVIVCPIVPTQSSSVLAFLVTALNPRRPYDADYQSFIHMLTEQVTTPQVSAVILREEVDRRQSSAKQEALDRAKLSRKLSESETKFAKFATRAPVGLAILSEIGLVLSANDLWRDLTQLNIGSTKSLWEEVLLPRDSEYVDRMRNRLLTERNPVTFQTRINKPWRAPDPDIDGNVQWTDMHLLIALYPDLKEDGSISTIMSCITNISELKWSESQLRRRMDQAIEMKKQQEKFIDVCSITL